MTDKLVKDWLLTFEDDAKFETKVDFVLKKLAKQNSDWAQFLNSKNIQAAPKSKSFYFFLHHHYSVKKSKLRQEPDDTPLKLDNADVNNVEIESFGRKATPGQSNVKVDTSEVIPPHVYACYLDNQNDNLLVSSQNYDDTSN